jgi:general stress protein CsbA
VMIVLVVGFSIHRSRWCGNCCIVVLVGVSVVQSSPTTSEIAALDRHTF